MPVASRTFSRTERLLDPGARIRPRQQLSRHHGPPAEQAGHSDARSLQVVDARLPPGTVQFDLPLASLAPDEYRVELAAANATGPRDEAKEILPSA